MPSVILLEGPMSSLFALAHALCVTKMMKVVAILGGVAMPV